MLHLYCHQTSEVEELFLCHLTGLMDLGGHLELNIARKFSKRPKELHDWLSKELLCVVGLDTGVTFAIVSLSLRFSFFRDRVPSWVYDYFQRVLDFTSNVYSILFPTCTRFCFQRVLILFPTWTYFYVVFILALLLVIIFNTCNAHFNMTWWSNTSNL